MPCSPLCSSLGNYDFVGLLTTAALIVNGEYSKVSSSMRCEMCGFHLLDEYGKHAKKTHEETASEHPPPDSSQYLSPPKCSGHGCCLPPLHSGLCKGPVLDRGARSSRPEKAVYTVPLKRKRASVREEKGEAHLVKTSRPFLVGDSVLGWHEDPHPKLSGLYLGKIMLALEDGTFVVHFVDHDTSARLRGDSEKVLRHSPKECSFHKQPKRVRGSCFDCTDCHVLAEMCRLTKNKT